MTRQAIARAPSSSSGPSRRRRSSSRRTRAAAPIRSARSRARRSVPILVGSDQIERGPSPTAITTRRSWCARRLDRRRLSQDAPRAVRRVRAAQAAVLLCGAARRSGLGLLGRRGCRCCCRSSGHLISTAICYEVVYPDLVRQFVARRQRAADDDHQRRLVRRDVGAVSALRAGVDARDRERALSGPRRQHRHQRHRRSVRPRARRRAASSSRRCSSARRGSCGRRRFYTRIGDIVRLRVGRGDAGAADRCAAMPGVAIVTLMEPTCLLSTS